MSTNRNRNHEPGTMTTHHDTRVNHGHSETHRALLTNMPNWKQTLAIELPQTQELYILTVPLPRFLAPRACFPAPQCATQKTDTAGKDAAAGADPDERADTDPRASGCVNASADEHATADANLQGRARLVPHLAFANPYNGFVTCRAPESDPTAFRRHSKTNETLS
eukprot:12353262-Alexandrium_andersonii.AAC.1